jgi:hypothetical protein
MRLFTEFQDVAAIVLRAKKSSRKGSYSEYEYYKGLLQDLNLKGTDYRSAVKQIADALRV